MTVVFQQQLITPQLATHWLSSNGVNRVVRPRYVKQLAGAMERGEWREDSGETIKLDPNENLLDGQHRLMAIIQSGVPLTLTIATGVPSEAFEVLDGGAKRTIGDRLRQLGYTQPNALAAAARLVWRYYTYGSFTVLGSGVDATFFQLLKVIDTKADYLYESITTHKRLKRQDVSLTVSPSVLEACFCLFAEAVDVDTAKSFYDEILLPPSKTAPTYALRRAWQKNPPERATVQGAKGIKAWNNWLEGSDLITLRWPSPGRGGHREKFPTVMGLDTP